MASQHRKHRGYETQRWVATWLAGHGFPFATDAGAGRQGRDILGTIGLAIEVKARRDLSLPSWLRQAAKTAAGDIPAVIHRPDGFGEVSMPDWPVTMRLEDWTQLVRAAGYGDPEIPSEGADEVAA